MDYNILKNYYNADLNADLKVNYKKNLDKDNRKFLLVKNKIFKNKNSNRVGKLLDKINDLENKLEFYKKYENNLSDVDLNIINNSIEIIDNLIYNLTKNMIIKGQVNRISKQIEFEF